MPAGVWARSVSASEIEVNWQALSFSAERVLGYEVHFILFKMEIEITHTHNTIQMLVITPVVPQSHHFQTRRRHGNGCFSPGRLLQPKLYSSLYRHDRKTCRSVYKRTKENCLSTCLFKLLSVTGWYRTHDSLRVQCQTSGQDTKKCHYTVWYCVFVICFYSLTQQHLGNLVFSLFSK